VHIVVSYTIFDIVRIKIQIKHLSLGDVLKL
jgi:hypothetical protein